MESSDGLHKSQRGLQALLRREAGATVAIDG